MIDKKMSDNHDDAEGAGDYNHVTQLLAHQDEILINQVNIMSHVDSKEDMFVDAMDDLSRESLANTEAETDTEEVSSSVSVEKPSLQENGPQDNHKEERETFAREIAGLCYQLKALTEQQQSFPVENNGEEVGDSDFLLRDMISDCSKYLKIAVEERLQTESTIRELNAILYTKDREIEDLNAKVTELSLSRDVAASYMNSVEEESLEVQLEKDRQIEVVMDRVLANLATVVYQEELLDNSVGGKIAHVEKNTYLLIERYNWMLYEIDQLRQCLSKVEADLRVHEQFGMVFAAARDELIELKTRDVELVEKLSHLEDENMRLVERVEKEKVEVETANAELGKTKKELEQEKTRCVNTKEKLSMAVTKGKALVQQRDSLKHSLAEKTSELEKCLTELQEKSSALEAAELCKGELVKCENLVASLQEALLQRDAILAKFGEILSLTSLPEELQSTDIIEKLKWLVDERNVMTGCKEELGKWETLAASLQEMLSQKNAILENFEEIMSQTSVPEELQSRDIIEKLKWLVDERNALAGCKEELVNWENLVASLQEMISQRNRILKNLEEILSQTSVPAELQSMDITDKLKWLVDETHVLKNISLEFDKLKNALSLVDPPANVSSSDFESQVGWLKESYDQAKDEIKMLQDEFARTNKAALNEIGSLRASLSVEVQEKDYLKEELGNLMSKYNEVVEKEHHVTLEKDHMVRMLLEGSGITTEDQEWVDHTSSDLAVLIDKCFGKIKERSSASIDTPCVDAELFERIQSLLYVKDQELMLCEKLLEEEVLVRSRVNDLSNELRAASQELATLKEEKGCLQKDLERSEEKSALLREKLSMAVKKGKGLVQDRENLKRQLDEKNSEIEKLRLELQQQESTVAEYRDQINRLSADLEKIPKLEGDLVAMKAKRDQLEQFLLESNNMLQSVIESIDGIVLPVDSVFEEPVEKVNWLAGYISECQNAKTKAEQELGKVKEEASTLAVKLAEAQSTMKSLEDALSDVENNFSQLAEEKKQIEVDKANVEQELQEAIEAARSQTSKFAEAFTSRKSVEDALSLAENNISVLINEKEEAQASRASMETELEKVREEVAIQTSKLTEAYKTMKSLEDALSQVETNVALLTKQNNDAHVGRTNLENELKKLKDEAESQASKLADACTTIKSLEDALSKAENDISVLEGEKTIAEQEISVLNSKLNACMDELAGTSGSLESRSIELMGHLNDFQMLMKDESLLSIVKKCFEKKFESLKEMDLILKSIEDHFVDTVSEALQNHPVMEDDLHVKNPFSDDLDNVVNVGMENGEVKAAGVDNISSCFRKTVEGFQMRNKIIAAKFEGFSTSTDEFIIALLGKLQATRDEVISMFEHMESLKQRVKNMENFKQEQEKALAMLENDVAILQSACTDATRQLQFEVKNNLLELSSVPELENLNHGLFPEVREVGGDDTSEHQQSPEGSKYVKTAEKLLFASREVQNLTKLFESTSNVAAATIQDLQKNLKDTRTAFEKAIEEREHNQNRVSQLEADVEALQNSSSELRLEVGDYQDKVDKLKEKKAELSSLYNSLLKKEQEAEDSLMSASQVKTLFDKISGIEIPFAEREVGELEPHGSDHVKKLFYIIDSVTELHHQITLLSHDKEELQSTLSAKILEIEHLKEEVETQIRNKPESEKMEDELLELTFSLERIIDMLGGNEFVVDQKSAGVKGLLTVLEKQVMTLLLEVENSKYKAQELGTELLGSQQVVDELSTKVKVLEDSLQGRTAQPEIVQERSIFEAPSLPTGSEISEIEDVGSLGKNSISPVPSAAHVRTMRKGSADQLAINIDSESARLINNEETDEDKGHAFKSLNTSGLIPKQGKLVADRIDGIWVSGGRVLMNRPRARLGLIAYWLFLHLWLLGTIL